MIDPLENSDCSKNATVWVDNTGLHPSDFSHTTILGYNAIKFAFVSASFRESLASFPVLGSFNCEVPDALM